MATQTLIIKQDDGWVEVTGFTKGSNANGQIIYIGTFPSAPTNDKFGHPLLMGEGIDVNDLGAGVVYACCKNGSAVLTYET
jgi:hypothetical protein